jgi:dienelactone hydrolase
MLSSHPRLVPIAKEVATSMILHEYVSQIAVLGYGFGGICALDLARTGADLKGAISVYGHFDPPP